LEVIRQKNATSKEIHTKIHELKSESYALNRFTHFAEVIASSVDGFKLMLAEKIQLKSRVSTVQWRWIKAINKVMIQIAVAKMKFRLEALEMKKKSKINWLLRRKTMEPPRSPHYRTEQAFQQDIAEHSASPSSNNSTPRLLHSENSSSHHDHHDHHKSVHLSMISERRKLHEVAAESSRRHSRSSTSSPVHHYHISPATSLRSSPNNSRCSSPARFVENPGTVSLPRISHPSMCSSPNSCATSPSQILENSVSTSLPIISHHTTSTSPVVHQTHD